MNELKQWTITVSAVAVLSGVMLMLIPGRKLKAAYRTLVSILLVYTFMLPFTSSFSLDFNIGDFLKDNYSVKGELDKYALQNEVSSAQKAIEQTLEDYFEDKNISFGCEVECAFEDEEIIIAHILIKSSEPKDKIIEEMGELGFAEGVIEIVGEADEQ